jgi:hypothetical protein
MALMRNEDRFACRRITRRQRERELRLGVYLSRVPALESEAGNQLL